MIIKEIFNFLPSLRSLYVHDAQYIIFAIHFFTSLICLIVKCLALITHRICLNDIKKHGITPTQGYKTCNANPHTCTDLDIFDFNCFDLPIRYSCFITFVVLIETFCLLIVYYFLWYLDADLDTGVFFLWYGVESYYKIPNFIRILYNIIVLLTWIVVFQGFFDNQFIMLILIPFRIVYFCIIEAFNYYFRVKYNEENKNKKKKKK
jgi:hypothetical protein